LLNSYPIGVFDSGYGGLTVLKELTDKLPAYDFIYLGDNARAPYGNRSFDTVYKNTLQCVKWFFQKGCSLVIIACNTASAKALRNIQQRDLPILVPGKRVLGVIRPSVENIGEFTATKNIGILGTKGTIESGSYLIEIAKYFPEIKVYQQACPLWASIVENNEYDSEGADYFLKKDINKLMDQSSHIDAILLACTHYPLLLNKISSFLRSNIKIISQGEIVAASLRDYLLRHPKIEVTCSKNSEVRLFTTDSEKDFDMHSAIFFGRALPSKQVIL
jgi:glutamate racemase